MDLTVKYLQRCGHDIRSLPSEPSFVAVPEEQVGFLMFLDSCKEFISSQREMERCDWCGRDGKMKRKGLCRHCNQVRKDLDKIEKLAASEPSDWWLNYVLKIARQKKKDCMLWAQMLRGILDGPVTCLSLEHWFRKIAKKIARDEGMYYGSANQLDSVFAPEQRQVLAYMFWEMFGAEASHNRQGRAMSATLREERREAAGSGGA